MRVDEHGLMDLATGAGCALQVARRVNAACIIYELRIYLSCALAVQTCCLRELRLLLGDSCRVTSYPRFPLLRRNTKLRNPNPKHHDYVYNRDANPSDGAGQRTE
jgi:hypothetical protein